MLIEWKIYINDSRKYFCFTRIVQHIDIIILKSSSTPVMCSAYPHSTEHRAIGKFIDSIYLRIIMFERRINYGFQPVLAQCSSHSSFKICYKINHRRSSDVHSHSTFTRDETWNMYWCFFTHLRSYTHSHTQTIPCVWSIKITNLNRVLNVDESVAIRWLMICSTRASAWL